MTGAKFMMSSNSSGNGSNNTTLEPYKYNIMKMNYVTSLNKNLSTGAGTSQSAGSGSLGNLNNFSSLGTGISGVNNLNDMNEPNAPRRWTEDEDMLLLNSVRKNRARNWKKIALEIPGRNQAQCLQRLPGSNFCL